MLMYSTLVKLFGAGQDSFVVALVMNVDVK